MQQKIQERIAETAEKYIGSKDWNYDVEKDNFDVGTNKCNKFVYDVTTEAGASPGTPNGHWLKRGFGYGSPPTAGQWADADYKIPGWKVVDKPRRGDVVAYSYNYSDATGHTAIVVGKGHSVGTSGTYNSIAITHFGFSNTAQYLPKGAKYVYRRYVGR